MRKNARWTRLTEWEHWPAQAYYLPLLPLFFLRYLKSGHPNHYLAANPGIKYSGNGTESKYESLQLVPPKFRPISLLARDKAEPGKALEQVGANRLNYPLIAKPDRGFRGYLVRKIDSAESLLRYLNQVQTDVLIQELVPFEKELGIFYHRYPGQDRGKITSVTIKEFLKVTGDGRKTLRELIADDSRAFLYQDIFNVMHKDRIDQILPEEEELVLSVIGNHSKGTRFVNGNHLIDDRLADLMNRLCLPMKGFYYGRLDIKYADFDRLLAGEDFKVIELNGIISEPTHIYDASHKDASYLNALRAINAHWSIMSEIALINHRERKVAYPGVREYIDNLRWLRRHSKMLKKLNSQEF
jgi:hypothetical protein